MWRDYILLIFTDHKCGILFMVTLFNFSSQVSIIQNSCMIFSTREWLRLFLEKYLGILLAIKNPSLCSWSHINLWIILLCCVSYHGKAYDSLGAYNCHSREIHSSHFGFYMEFHGVGREAYATGLDLEKWLWQII